MIEVKYRADYAGEFVVVETQWTGGRKQQQREWVSNPIENHHISGRAACIGSDVDQHRFDFTRLQRHRGGLLGSKKLQTYGTGPISKKMKLDFTIETHPELLEEIAKSNYCEQNIVYTSARNCIKNPGFFYLIPYNPGFLDPTTIAYLAAFDQHKEIFLLGYHKDTPIDSKNWYLQFVTLMTAYTGVKFYFVGEPTNMFDEWLDCANASTMTYREFISYCDI